MQDIDKRFPGVHALKKISFTLKKGEIHGLVGENGAGKSTLMKILGGVYTPDFGSIYLEGKEITSLTPKLAAEYGINFIHQEINLADRLTVAENLFLGRLPMKRNVVDYAAMFASSQEILDNLKINIDPHELVSNLSVAQKQMIQIGRSISHESKLLIFDEPTTSLTDKDVSVLFDIMRKFAASGVAIIYISHRLKEIFEICDAVTVLRDGEFIGSEDISELSNDVLIKMMVGRELKQLYPKGENMAADDIAMEVEHLYDEFGKVKDVSFYVKKGEILGFSGLVGAGRTEMAKLVFGAERKLSGIVKINGKEVAICSPESAIKSGLCLLTEDRKYEGLFLELSVMDNINITNLGGNILNLPKLSRTAREIVKKMNVKTHSIMEKIGNLSGGNQQKVIIGRWLNADSDIYIFDEATKGIDIGAKNEIYKQINQLVASGKTVIVISSELVELLGICDRVYVMCEGKITGELDRSAFNQEKIMYYSTLGGTI